MAKSSSTAKPNWKMTMLFSGLSCGIVNELYRVTLITRELKLCSTTRVKQTHGCRSWVKIDI